MCACVCVKEDSVCNMSAVCYHVVLEHVSMAECQLQQEAPQARCSLRASVACWRTMLTCNWLAGGQC